MAEITPIQFYRGTAAAVASANPVLAVGKPFFETDTGVFKIGDGVTSYNSLPSVGSAGSGDDKLDSLITSASHTGNYTVASADLIILTAGGTLEISGNDTGDLTIPLNSSVAIPIGKWFTAKGYDNVVATGGVTITGTRGDLTIPSGLTVGLQKTNTDTWLLHNGTAGGGGGGGTWGSITGTLSAQTDLNTALGLKAPLASPTFTGTPAAPTAAAATSTTQIATTAFVTTADNLKSDALSTVSTKTANYTLVSGDLTNVSAGKKLSFLMNVASANDFNIVANATVAFPVGTIIYITQYGAGQTTVVPAGGVTMRSAISANKSYAQYSEMRLEKIGSDEWLLTGDIVP